MQSGSAVLAPVPVPQTSDCMIFTSQNSDNSSEVSPVNLVTFANRIQNSGMDVLYCPSAVTSYSAYSQNSDSPSKSNCPIDLVVSAPRAESERSELLNSNHPVDLAACGHKRPDYSTPSNPSVNDISATSLRISSVVDGSQPLASAPNNAFQTVCTVAPGQGTLSQAAQPGAYHNVICSLAAVYSARPLQSVAYPRSAGLTHSLPSSYQSSQWQPMLSPSTAQLMASAVCNTSSQPVQPENAVKEGEPNPLLLQLQVFLKSYGLCLRCLCLKVICKGVIAKLMESSF